MPEELNLEFDQFLNHRESLLSIFRSLGIEVSAGNIIGTISGRSTATIATAIDPFGNFINNLINTNLDTSAKTILGDFIFGESGAIKMITDANNGLWLSPTGILGKKAGVTTFAIDTSGNATFAGTLSAAVGTLGTITSCNITGGAIDIAFGAVHYFQVSNTGVLFLRTENVGATIITNTLTVNASAGSSINLGIAITDITLLSVVRQTTGVTSNNLFTLTDAGTTSNSSKTLSITSASTGYGVYLNKTGAGTGMYIKQDGSHNAALDIEQNGASTFGIRVTQNAAADAARFISAATSGVVSVVSIFQNSATSGSCLTLSGYTGKSSHLRLIPIADAPDAPTEGDLYADTDHKLYYYNGTAWKVIAFV